ncbi:MAG TPA: ADOP family duplicated permease [Vicinamibacterales bacterium]|nr:ADOP family duplicated permease [Vicinamibacterales bacterium]
MIGLTDLRLAIRSLLRARGFTATAILTLGLGLALCTAAMVVVNAYLFSDLPYPAADRLYAVRYSAPGQDQPRNMEALDWSSLDDLIEHPVAWDLDAFYLLGGENAERAAGAWVTPGFVQALGIQPVVGRGFDASAFAPGGGNVALISHRLWHARYGGDPAVVGRTFVAYVSDRPEEAESFTIIGVLPEGLWHFNPYTDILAPLRAPTYPYMVRLRHGVAPQTAAARITSLVGHGAANVPPNWRAEVVSAHAQYVAAVRPLLRTVTSAAALVLLVACGNVATLLLIRTTRRHKEIAVRSALGAGRWAIARMLLAEALVLGTAAAVLALFATRLALGSIAPLVQQQLGRTAPGGAAALAIDTPAMTAVIAAGILTAIICSMAPLVTTARLRLLGALQSGGRTATDGVGTQRIRAALIALEIAASLTLVAGSTLMLRTVITLLHTDLGFSGERILNTSVTLRQNRYPDATSRLALFERMAARLAAVPGAESVGMTTAWPLQQAGLRPVETPPDAPDHAATRAAVQGVNDAYFTTLDIPIVAGRAFTRSDRVGTDAVALVSETLARRLWPGGNPLGRLIVVPQDQDRGEAVPITRVVVGVVRDVRQVPADEDLADLYVPVFQAPGRFAFVLIRTAGAPGSWLTPIRAAFGDVDPEIAVQGGRPLLSDMNQATSRPRFLAWLLGSFAAIAALLALVGAYGVIAYAVRQREREIAVRLAIGADPARITRLFLQQGGSILLAGLLLGLAGALAAGRLIESQLYGVTPRDPLALASTVLAFATAGLLAIWWPARRAAATDPALALRSE